MKQLRSFITVYLKQMETLVKPLATSQFVYEETIKENKKEINEWYLNYKDGYYPEEWVDEKVVELIQWNVHWFAVQKYKVDKI